MSAKPAVAVVGSLSVDFVLQVARRPQKGETVIASSFDIFVGGKGNNQALAAARAGAKTSIIGKIGQDAFGHQIETKLKAAGVDTTYLFRDAETSSGIADIMVDRQGENSIVVAPQANHKLEISDIEKAASVFNQETILLTQLEIKYETALAAAKLAKQNGAFTILNPAPAPPEVKLPAEFYRYFDLIVPNQTEAELLTGIACSGKQDSLPAARKLLAMGFRQVIITLGAAGAYYLDKNGVEIYCPSFPVNVIDTTAAGDAFCGALATALAEKMPAGKALKMACAAGALATTSRGAEPSLPDRTAINQVMLAGSTASGAESSI